VLQPWEPSIALPVPANGCGIKRQTTSKHPATILMGYYVSAESGLSPIKGVSEQDGRRFLRCGLRRRLVLGKSHWIPGRQSLRTPLFLHHLLYYGKGLLLTELAHETRKYRLKRCTPVTTREEVPPFLKISSGAIVMRTGHPPKGATSTYTRHLATRSRAAILPAMPAIFGDSSRINYL
jgi:hypothetical protein